MANWSRRATGSLGTQRAKVRQLMNAAMLVRPLRPEPGGLPSGRPPLPMTMRANRSSSSAAMRRPIREPQVLAEERDVFQVEGFE